jgi:hypothetical protein
MKNYRRYSKFTKEGKSLIVPFISIPYRSGDFFEKYESGITRMDLLSYKYYNNPDYAWLIMQANPQYGSLEFLIPDGSEIRIPYPLDAVLEGYDAAIREYDRLYGLE